jgi:hypothetical protein
MADEESNVFALPAKQNTQVAFKITPLEARCGLRMDRSRITGLKIEFNPDGEATGLVYISNLCVSPERDGHNGDRRIGRIPGKNPAALAKDLLEDPEVKALVPVLKDIPPKRVAFVSHSASISAHWATSGGYLDIAAEVVKAVNPSFEYKDFTQGGMSAETAVAVFLQQMIAYKPTDTYLQVVPSPMEAEQKLANDMKAAGSRVYILDAVMLCGEQFPKPTLDALTKYAEDTGGKLVRLRERCYGAPTSPHWQANDKTHMTTLAHMALAKELLKEWARIYGPPQKAQ